MYYNRINNVSQVFFYNFSEICILLILFLTFWHSFACTSWQHVLRIYEQDYRVIVEWTINRTRLRGRGNLAPTGFVALASALKCLLNSKLDYIVDFERT